MPYLKCTAVDNLAAGVIKRAHLVKYLYALTIIFCQDASDVEGEPKRAGTHQRIDRPLLPASCHMRPRRPAGGRVPRQGVTCCGQVSGNRSHYRRLGGTAVPPLPRPRRPCPLVLVPLDTDPLAALCAAGVRHRAAPPVGDQPRAAQRPSAVAALQRTRPPWCPAAGRVARWTDTTDDRRLWLGGCVKRSVSARVATSPLGLDGGGTYGGYPGCSRRCRPGWLSGLPDTGGQLAASRHGMCPGVTATGTGRRGGGGWWDVANAGRHGRAGRSAGRGVGRGRRSSPAG
jgi:hypothetical protein